MPNSPSSFQGGVAEFGILKLWAAEFHHTLPNLIAVDFDSIQLEYFSPRKEILLLTVMPTLNLLVS